MSAEFPKQVLIDLTRKAVDDSSAAVSRTMVLLPPEHQASVVMSCAANIICDLYLSMVKAGMQPDRAKHALCAMIFKTLVAADEAERTGNKDVQEIRL